MANAIESIERSCIMNTDDTFCVSREAAEREGFEFNQDIAEKAGMTMSQVEEALFRVLFAMRRTFDSFSEDEIQDIIMAIALKKYEILLIQSMN